MPIFARLSVEEADQLRKRRVSKIDLSQYEAFMADLNGQTWATITLEPEDKPRTVKRRFTSVAHQHGKRLRYSTKKELGDGVLLVRIVPEDEAGWKKRRGPSPSD